MAATMVLGLPDHYCSHEFAAVYVHQLIQAVQPPVREVTSVDNTTAATVDADGAGNDASGDLLYDEEELVAAPGEDGPNASQQFINIDEVLDEVGEDGDGTNMDDAALTSATSAARGKDMRELIITNDEVRLDSKPKCNQAMSYVHRSQHLEQFCAYDLFAQFAKRPLSAGGRARREPFLETHPQADKFHLQQYEQRRIPRLVGAGFSAWPSDDASAEAKEKFACFVLVLFKPWRTRDDLLAGRETMWDALAAWFPTAPQEIRARINNGIGLYGDKTDPHDTIDPLAHDPEVPDNGAKEVRAKTQRAHADVPDTEAQDMQDEDEAASMSKNARAALAQAVSQGIALPGIAGHNQHRAATTIQVDPTQSKAWAKHELNRAEVPGAPTDVQSPVTVLSVTAAAGVRPPVEIVPQPGVDVAAAVADQFHLNERQILAFSTIVSAVTGVRDGQLGLYVSGAAGTGKSQVLKATSAFMASTNQVRQLRVVAYMGAAAVLVHGETISHALGFGKNVNGNDVSPQKMQQLKQDWNLVRLLVIDEISTVSASMLAAMNTRLQLIKGVNEYFGGLHVVALGDLHQCPPVAAQPFWKRPNTKAKAGTHTAHQLWTNFFNVHIGLVEIMRQREEAQWAHLLQRLHDDKCTVEDDVKIEEIARRDQGILSDPEWRKALIVTTSNDAREALSNMCAQRDAAIQGEPLIEWSATYYRGDERIASTKGMRGNVQGIGPDKFRYVAGMPVMLTSNQVCGAESVSLGLANGSTGTAVGLVLNSNEPPRAGNGATWALRYAPIGMFVSFAHIDVAPLPNLPAEVIQRANGRASTIVYITMATVAIGNSPVRRRQLPLMPAYALTIHKSQGMTVDRLIFDCTSTFHAASAHHLVYVALTRVKSSNRLAFLGNPPKNLLHFKVSDELKHEDKRLQNINLK